MLRLPSLVLCYHAVSPTWTAPLSVTPDALTAHLELLARRGMRGVRFTDLAADPGRDGLVAITFDDAYRSVVSLAKPILDRLGWPATVFVPTAFPSAGAPMTWPGIDHWLGTQDEDELLPLGWAELGSLVEAGWEVGSHTRTHPHLTTLAPAALDEELRGSRAAVESELGVCTSIAYPYGDVDDRVVAAARAAGYEAGAALTKRPSHPAAHAWPRVGVWHRDTPGRFRFKVSPTGRRLSALPRPGRGGE